MTTAALCRPHLAAGRDWWTSSDPDEQEAARWICLTGDRSGPCPLLTSCLERALAEGDVWNVCGGTTAEERLDMAEQRGFLKPVVRGSADHGENARYISGCRCPDCTAGHSSYVREWRANRRWAGADTHPTNLVVVEQLTLFEESA